LGKVLSSLEFELRMQEFFNFLHKSNDSVGAMRYAQKNLVKFVQSAMTDQGAKLTLEEKSQLNAQMDEVIKAMGLIGYPSSLREQNAEYKRWTRSGRWEDLATQFESEVFALYGLQTHSLVTQTLQTGISVLKTSLCEDKAEDELLSITRGQNDAEMMDDVVHPNGKCPACDPKIRQLSGDLPNSLHTLTQLSCSLTG